MNYRMIAALVLGVLVLNLGGSTFADTKNNKQTANQLVSLLPASDGVVAFDGKRFFGDALPKLLAANQPMLGKVTSGLNDIQGNLGFDLRQFDEVAVGFTAKPIAAKQYDVEPVIIGRGQTPSATLIGGAKTASASKYREERVGRRTMYIYDTKSLAKDPNASFVRDMPEVGVAALDDRTVAFGEVARVRQTLEQKTRVSSELVGMLGNGAPSAAVFAIKPPAGLKAYLPLENDELGKNIDSIKYIYGSANVTDGTVVLQTTARTLQIAQATSLYDTLSGLQALGKAFLGGGSGNRAVYARLVENVKFSVKANEVTLDLAVAQSDIDVLVGSMK